MTELNKEWTIQQIQTEIDEYIQQFEVGYFPPLAQLARLSEEVGELAREINHCYGPKQKKDTEQIQSIEEEIGDILITTVIMANSLDIDLTKVFEKNMGKFNQRDKFRFTRKDGLS